MGEEESSDGGDGFFGGGGGRGRSSSALRGTCAVDERLSRYSPLSLNVLCDDTITLIVKMQRTIMNFETLILFYSILFLI